jgi:integrase
LPRLGSKKVGAVQSRDIHALHVAMKDTPYQANRVSAPALALLAEMRKAADAGERYLFPGNAPDKHLQGIKKFWRSVIEQAGLENYRLHDNRHTHASHLVSSGLSLEIVGRLLGHTNPLTTKRYAHLADDPLRAAAERFGSKMDALREDRQADIVPIPSRR